MRLQNADGLRALPSGQLALPGVVRIPVPDPRSLRLRQLELILPCAGHSAESNAEDAHRGQVLTVRARHLRTLRHGQFGTHRDQAIAMIEWAAGPHASGLTYLAGRDSTTVASTQEP